MNIKQLFKWYVDLYNKFFNQYRNQIIVFDGFLAIDFNVTFLINYRCDLALVYKVLYLNSFNHF